MRMKSRVKWLALITFLVLSFPLISLGQEEEGTEESAEEESEEKESEVEVKESFSDRLVAAAWCPIQRERTHSDPIPEPDENEEESEETSESDTVESGCDTGIGVSLWSSNRFPKVFIAGAVGLKSVAIGLGWLAYSGEVTIAVAVGLMAPLDKGGIYLGEVEPAIGATFGF